MATDQYAKDKRIIYKKLVRDLIPDIIKKHGKSPLTRIVDGQDLRDAIGRKILEETHELFTEWRKGDNEGVLKESGDLLEIVLAALSLSGYDIEDLLNKQRERAEKRGGFKNGIFLESVGEASDADEIEIQSDPILLFNPGDNHRLINLIQSELQKSQSVWVATAFYSPGQSNLLINEFEEFTATNGQLRVLLSTMGNINRPEHLTHLQKFVTDINVRVFHPPDLPFDQVPPNFHVKTWLFHHNDGSGAVLIGSSNFTESGFNKNVEWNYFTQNEVNLPFDGTSPFNRAKAQFDRFWKKSSVEVTEAFLQGYRQRRQRMEMEAGTRSLQDQQSGKHELFDGVSAFKKTQHDVIIPNAAQKEALENLDRVRREGARRTAVIAATGIGKTFLAAFDYQQTGFKTLLFIAHRETIIDESLKSFRAVFVNRAFGHKVGGGYGVTGSPSQVFAMVQTLSKREHLHQFPPEHFEYIVIDEFHHGEAASYKRLLSYFKPKFLLGLTATPERMDGRSVLRLCDYNVAYEVRLLDAIDRGWLSPFQYFAIHDETDYSQIRWTGGDYDEADLTRTLSNDTRTAIIAHNLKKYLPSKGKTRALAFCSSVSHARFTAERLTQAFGIESIALWGESSEPDRYAAIQRLQSESNPLQVICSVDIFNEGIDIPEVSHILMLRPTQSFPVFLQQLGRGLRKTDGKDFLVVLDFIGNFRKVHVAPLALQGYTSLSEYMNDNLAFRFREMPKRLPTACFLNADTEVRRIWDREINRVLQSQLSTKDQLRGLYLKIIDELEVVNPGLMDVLYNIDGADPHLFIKHFDGWLRAKQYCEQNLSTYENSLLDTPAEAFLNHLESGLNPTKSYKMVVLLALLDLPGHVWEIEDIAKGFLSHFLENPHHIQDYPELARAEEPTTFSLSKVKTHLQTMPLKFLSNKESDFFVFHRRNGTFELKPEIASYWKNKDFKAIVRDRVEYALTRYFMRNQTLQVVRYDPDTISNGFDLEPKFVERFLIEEKLQQGETSAIKFNVGRHRLDAIISRSKTGRRYRVIFKNGSLAAEKISSILSAAKHGANQQTFAVKADQKAALRISA